MVQFLKKSLMRYFMLLATSASLPNLNQQINQNKYLGTLTRRCFDSCCSGKFDDNFDRITL